MRTILRALVMATLAAAWPGTTSAHAQADTSAATQGRAGVDTLRVTLAEARRLALRQNPAFLAEREERTIAAGRLRQARTYPFNPEVEVEAPGSISSGLEGYEAWLWQEVEWAGQRGLRSEAAERGLASAAAAVADAARRTVADVSVAFYAALASRRRLDVAEGYLGLNTRLLEAVRIQMSEGEISVMEANFAEIEAGRARALVLGNRREATRASLELGRLLGQPPDAVTIPRETAEQFTAGGALNADSLVDVALSRRPDLRARVAAERRAETLTRLARRTAIPNLRIGAVLDQDPASGSRSWGFGAALPLPLWNRNQGLVESSFAETRQATFSRRAVELRVRTEVEQAVRAYRTAVEEAEIYESDVLEPARENQALLDTAYRAGRIGLPELVLLRNQLLQAELDYWESWLRLRSAWIELQSAIGGLGEPARAPDEEET